MGAPCWECALHLSDLEKAYAATMIDENVAPAANNALKWLNSELIPQNMFALIWYKIDE